MTTSVNYIDTNLLSMGVLCLFMLFQTLILPFLGIFAYIFAWISESGLDRSPGSGPADRFLVQIRPHPAPVKSKFPNPDPTQLRLETISTHPGSGNFDCLTGFLTGVSPRIKKTFVRYHNQDHWLISQFLFMIHRYFVLSEACCSVLTFKLEASDNIN